jgi:altronate dehydratase
LRARADRDATIDDVGRELVRLILDAAGGPGKPWAAHWKPHRALVPFNLAPVS